MERHEIRDRRSDKKIKPRVMDFIIDDDGNMLLEVKNGNFVRTIELNDMQEQIKEYMK